MLLRQRSAHVGSIDEEHIIWQLFLALTLEKYFQCNSADP